MNEPERQISSNKENVADHVWHYSGNSNSVQTQAMEKTTRRATRLGKGLF